MQQILIFLMFVAVFGLIAGMLLLTLALLSPKSAKPVIPLTTCAIILTGSASMMIPTSGLTPR